MHEVSGTWFSFGWFPSMVGGWLWSIPTLLSKSATDDGSITNSDKSNSVDVISSQAKQSYLTNSNEYIVNSSNSTTKSNVLSSQLTLHTKGLVDTHFPFFHYSEFMHFILNGQRIILLKCMQLWQTCRHVYRVTRHQIHESWNYTKSLEWLEEALDSCHVDVSVGVNIYRHPVKYTYPYKSLTLSSQRHQQKQYNSQITNNATTDNTNSNNSSADQGKGFTFPCTIQSQRDRRSWNSFVILSAH